MLTTPFGSIRITIDDREIEYVAVKLPLGIHFYSGATGRYAIRIDLVPDGAEHNINCRLIEIPSNVEGWSNSGEDIECMTFNTGDNKTELSIACLGETWEMGCTTESMDRGYDYDTVTLVILTILLLILPILIMLCMLHMKIIRLCLPIRFPSDLIGAYVVLHH